MGMAMSVNALLRVHAISRQEESRRLFQQKNSVNNSPEETTQALSCIIFFIGMRNARLSRIAFARGLYMFFNH
jgi:hypothetical protein